MKRLASVALVIFFFTLLAACQRSSSTPWWNDAVFYQVFVRSFADSTTGPLANDGIGDLQGLIEKLDYLNDGDPQTSDDLGVTGLWLMPIMPSPSYHGYDVTDFYSVNPQYGTTDDFKRLMTEAHQRGIKIIIDLVLNHTSSQHPWFKEALNNPDSPRHAWYIWSKEKPNYTGPWGQPVWHSGLFSGYYYGIFDPGMPDLNYKNPEVTKEMQKVANFWLKDLGVDGFRLDAARHLIEEERIQENTQATHDWWKAFRKEYKAANRAALTVGEIWTNNAAVATYVKGDELDLAFNFDLAGAVLLGVRSGDAARIQAALSSSYELFGVERSATFLTNHDMNRAMDQLELDVVKAKLAAAVLFTTPGVPFIYYGEEIGMTGKKPDELIRTPMQWSAEPNAGFTTGKPWQGVNGDYPQKNVTLQSQDPASLLSFYRTMIHLRSSHTALRTGEYTPLVSQDISLLSYLRSSPDELVLVLVNLGQKPTSDYNLSLKDGQLKGAYQASYLYGGAGGLPPLTANAAGGFDAYHPLPEIPAGEILLVQLTPAK